MNIWISLPLMKLGRCSSVTRLVVCTEPSERRRLVTIYSAMVLSQLHASKAQYNNTQAKWQSQACIRRDRTTSTCGFCPKSTANIPQKV